MNQTEMTKHVISNGLVKSLKVSESSLDFLKRMASDSKSCPAEVSTFRTIMLLNGHYFLPQFVSFMSKTFCKSDCIISHPS